MRALGLRVKSGFAIAVTIEGDAQSWRVAQRDQVLLTTEEGPYARFPFHPLVEMAPEAGAAVCSTAVGNVRSESRKRLAVLLKSIGSLDAACVVSGSMIEPDTVANLHIRAHAREGQLFREVVIDALECARIPHEILRDKHSYEQVALKLQLTQAGLRSQVNSKGHGLVKPWRSDEKLATVGALSALVTQLRRGGG
jgi:hypothetical protein